jgi:hypothetical protein
VVSILSFWRAWECLWRSPLCVQNIRMELVKRSRQKLKDLHRLAKQQGKGDGSGVTDIDPSILDGSNGDAAAAAADFEYSNGRGGGDDGGDDENGGADGGGSSSRYPMGAEAADAAGNAKAIARLEGKVSRVVVAVVVVSCLHAAARKEKEERRHNVIPVHHTACTAGTGTGTGTATCR